MHCTNCGQENAAGQKFCGNCGTKLASGCPNCGTENPPGNRFCGECGTALTGGAVPTVAASAVAEPDTNLERRVVSVLFVDLVGYTSFSDGRDTEDVRAFLTDYFDRAKEIVERFGGVVEKFIGDAVMAAWGAVAANEDDAERAVRAGMELVDMVAKLGADAGVAELAARAGVLTGEASVRSDTNSEGMVIGDLVNTAARLQGSAQPGTVFVGETTYRATGESIQYQEIGALDMKGKEMPVAAWKALRIVAQVGGALRSDGLEPPFTGRDPELRMLKDQLHAAEREGRARLVSVIGQAGIGKSRLVWEFQKYIDGLIGDIYWHQGRSPAYGDNLAFWAIGEMVRHRARIRETHDAATTRTRLREMIDTYIPDQSDQRWVEPHLESLLGLRDGSVGEGSEQAAAFRLLFERIASNGPTVLVFEDLHWADPAMLDFVEELTDWSRDHPIMVVTLARADLLERRPTWGAGKRGFISLNLSPLSDEDMSELLSGLVPGIPEDTLTGVIERSGGVPMYAVEYVRMLLGQGAIAQLDDGTFEITGDLTQLSVPESVSAVIGARLDRLDEDDRLLLQDAAVIGHSFSIDGVAHLVGEANDVVEERLAPLVRNELLEIVRDPRSPERGQYRFVQGLIREVAHARISRDVRRSRHLKVADFFAGLDDEELAGIVAYHLVEALRATPDADDAAELRGRASSALIDAIDRADDLNAWDQCLGLAKQAEEFFTEPADLLPFLERATAAAEHLARFDECEAYAQRCIDVARALGDESAEAHAMSLLGTAYNVSARSSQAIKVLEPYLNAHPDPTGDAGLARAYMALARGYLLTGQTHEAAEAGRAALEAGDALGLDEVTAQAMITRGTALSDLSRFRESMALLQAALRIADEQGLVGTKLRALANIGYASEDPKESVEATRRGYEESRRVGDKSHLQFFAGNWASTLLWNQDPAPIGDMENDPVFADAPPGWWATYRVYRSGAAVQMGDVDEARRQYELARDLAEGIDDLQVSQQLRRAELMLLLTDGRFREAFDIAMDISRSTEMAPGLNLYWIRNAAMFANDASMRAELLARIEEVPESSIGTRIRREMEALDLIASGEMEQGLDLISDSAEHWTNDDVEKEAAFLFAATAVTLPDDHPLRADYARRAREGFAKFNLDPAMLRNRL